MSTEQRREMDGEILSSLTLKSAALPPPSPPPSTAVICFMRSTAARESITPGRPPGDATGGGDRFVQFDKFDNFRHTNLEQLLS